MPFEVLNVPRCQSVSVLRLHVFEATDAATQVSVYITLLKNGQLSPPPLVSCIRLTVQLIAQNDDIFTLPL